MKEIKSHGLDKIHMNIWRGGSLGDANEFSELNLWAARANRRWTKKDRQIPQNINQNMWAKFLIELLKTRFTVHEEKVRIISNKIIPD